MQIIVSILQGINLVGTLLPTTMQAALDIAKIFQDSGTEYTVRIQALRNGAIQSATETLSMIDAWKSANGYLP